MRRLGLLSAPVLAVVLAIGPLASAAAAEPREDYSGSTLLESFSFGEVRNTGKVNHFEFFSANSLAGDFDAEVTNETDCIGYEVQFERSFTCHGTSVTTGTLSEELGGEPFSTTARIRFRCSFETGECSGNSVIYAGTGAFAGARGVTTFEQDAFTGVGTWTASIG